MTNKYDLVIIGAGPAGLTAGIYAAGNGLKTVILSRDIGGTANSILRIENWPGFKGTGAELMKKFYEHVKSYNVNLVTEDVEKIEKKDKKFLVYTKKEKFETGAVIIAIGRERKRLNIPGEDKLRGKGVSYCVTCDAFFFKNKITAVIGGSDCAATSALALADMVKKVYILYRGEKLRCEAINSKRLEEKKNVEIMYNTVPVEIKGKEKVEGLIIKEGKQEKEIKLDAVFIEIGSTPITELTKNLGLKLNEEDFIIVDDRMETSVEGIFAAGDITNSKLKQVLVASSQGAIAAKSVSEFLRK
jgi:thioredoxin reductase (NADPH)